MRARAIENGCFVLAAAQGGTHENGRETFGHSLVVDPWGRILAEGGTEPGVVMAEIDPAEVVAARAQSAVAAARAALRGDRADGGAHPSACGAGADMIRYALVCDRKHEFEIWFKNSADYDKQAKRGLVTCPVCGSTKVEKALMAPSLGAGAKKKRPAAPRPHRSSGRAGEHAARADRPVAMMSPQEQEFRSQAQGTARPSHQERRQCRQEIPGRSAQDALRRDRAPLDLRRSLAEDAKELHEEGIEFHPLPILPDERN